MQHQPPLTGAWIYVITFIIKSWFDWDFQKTATEIKLIEYNEKTIPCLVIALWNTHEYEWLKQIPIDFRVKKNGTGNHNEMKNY